jgi:hypothetical protein
MSLAGKKARQDAKRQRVAISKSVAYELTIRVDKGGLQPIGYQLHVQLFSRFVGWPRGSMTASQATHEATRCSAIRCGVV